MAIRAVLTLSPALLLPLGIAATLTILRAIPDEAAPLLARYADDQAAVAGAVAAGATLIGLAAPGAIAVQGAPGLVARLRATGATRITPLRAALGCLAAPFDPRERSFRK
ncbi:conserved protein of unknown function [Rhodovastum atsumiense]|uniref:Uncharacterized protein n=1 Tax=Rhodovastum atsumiense TaxID=504468 RepID=A0A5M6IXL7_9PROT|nr:hypothetical protein [Rhodovastum atsumiense]KAA5612709.1 hypothetical protein F1189_08200 [Rhodovastum atsumiense]CAH2602740.1 conserved protein of unknown function [Rhodovastum atsumiense]